MRLKKHFPIILTALILIIFILVFGCRFIGNRPVFMGDWPYFYMYLSESSDLNSVGENFTNPHQVFIVFFASIFGKYSLLGISLVLAIWSALLAYKILDYFNYSFVQRASILVVFISSPFFIGTLIMPDVFLSITFFQFLAFFLLLQDSRYLRGFSYITYVVASLFSIIHLVISLAILLFYCSHKKMYRPFYIQSALSSLVIVVYYIPSYLFFPELKRFVFDSSTVSHFITDFGATFGFSMFMIALAVVGLFRFYKRRHLFFIFCMLIIIFLSFFYAELKVYANFELAFLSGLAVAFLINRNFDLPSMRDFSIILVMCGLLFGTVSYIDRAVQFPPSAELRDALIFIRDNTSESSVVFSDIENGFWIYQISKRRPVTDKNMLKNPDYFQYINKSTETLYSWDIRKTRTLLQDLNTTHILITDAMFEGIWQKPDQGLHSLLKNNETFKKLYQVNTTEVWQFFATK